MRAQYLQAVKLWQARFLCSHDFSKCVVGTAQQLLEARLSAKRVIDGFGFDLQRRIGMDVEGFFQIDERRFFVAEL